MLKWTPQDSKRRDPAQACCQARTFLCQGLTRTPNSINLERKAESKQDKCINMVSAQTKDRDFLDKQGDKVVVPAEAVKGYTNVA